MSFWHVVSTPGTDLAKEGLLNWVGGGIMTFVQILPELATIAAMCCLILGMLGSKKFMGFAGTCVLVAFAGVLLNAAL